MTITDIRRHLMTTGVESVVYTEADIAAIFKVSNRTVNRWVKNGFLPKPLPIASRRSCLRWHRANFDKWFAQFEDGAV